MLAAIGIAGLPSAGVGVTVWGQSSSSGLGQGGTEETRVTV